MLSTGNKMSNFYSKHIFFCNNIRPHNQACCAQFNAKKAYQYAKDKCRAQGLLGPGKIAVSESRCLGRCESGPVAVVYPDSVWYQYIDEQDIDEIISQHLLRGQVVERLKID